jgi:predicted O-methyltransferase YrrM
MSEIPYPLVDLAAIVNPIPAIMSAPEFEQTVEFFRENPARSRSLLGPASQALIFALVRNGRPEHVVEIGTYKAGTTEAISRALDANGAGLVHTMTPFDIEDALQVIKSWPENLQSRVRFYPADSMSFFMQIQREAIHCELVLVDGCHDYEFALFDIQCAARSMTPGGFILVDNAPQAGPYFAALDFMKSNPGWVNCESNPSMFNPNLAFDRKRRPVAHTGFIALRAPVTYALQNRPRTFGETIWSSASVKGVRLQLGETNSGTLHAQCVLRGFGSARGAEQMVQASLAIDDQRGAVTIMFENALALEGNWSRYSVEPWLIWEGGTPLILSDLPQVI